MVISQKAPLVEYCRPSYACQHIGRCVPVLHILQLVGHSKKYFLYTVEENFTAPVQGHFHDVVTFGKCTNLQRFCVHYRTHNTKLMIY